MTLNMARSSRPIWEGPSSPACQQSQGSGSGQRLTGQTQVSGETGSGGVRRWTCSVPAVVVEEVQEEEGGVRGGRAGGGGGGGGAISSMTHRDGRRCGGGVLPPGGPDRATQEVRK